MAARSDPTGHQAIIDHWCQLYERTRGQKYYFQPRDAKVIKELRAMVKDDDELKRLMAGYLAMDDDWLEDKGKALHFLPGNLQKVVQFVRRTKRTAPVSKAVVEPMQAWLEGRRKAVNE